MYKRVGIDIDNTITNLDITLAQMARFYDKPVPTIDMITDFNLSSVYGISVDESREFWREMEHTICDTAEVNHERLDNLYRLFTNHNTDIYIITSRGEEYYDVTKNWLNRNCITHKELIMTGGKSKVDVLRDYDIEVMIDDKSSLFHEVKEAGLKTLMVCIDYPYNQDVSWQDCFVRLSREGLIMSHVR